MKTSDILNYARKVPWLFKLLFLPYQIGFVKGHSHLTTEQVIQIQQSLDLNNNISVVNAYEQRLSSLIGTGSGISFAAGRMAFYSLLKILDIGKGDEVILPGFTCSVMPNAVWRTQATPVFADIDAETLGSSAEGIEARITSRTKMVVAQHSFGIPCNISEIADLCDEKGIFLVEDCAITFDSSINGIKVGNWGDAAIFSTDHTKPINTIIGGFLYTTNKSLYNEIKNYTANMSQLDKKHQERLYNQFMFERKHNTPHRYPRTVFMDYMKAAKKIIWLKPPSNIFLENDYTKESSNKTYPYPAKMPQFLAQLGLFELDRWNYEKKKRKKILYEYLNVMKELNLEEYLPKAYLNDNVDIIPLRLAFQHPHSKSIKEKMSKFIDVNGIWFKEPIICCSYGPDDLGYKFGSCRVAENIGRNILNFPCVLPENWDNKALEIFKMVMKNDNNE